MSAYEHAIAITSQLPFCSVPLRLDAYNQCQFSCAFCFSKARGGNVEQTGLQFANSTALAARLKRVANGDVRSGLDEFLHKRVPIQFGGMNDPFGPWERERGIGLQLLRILADADYPTLISTKSTLLAEGDYRAALRAGNFYVRQSLTALPAPHLRRIERGTPSTDERLKTTETISSDGVAVSIRLQPIFLGYEEEAEKSLSGISAAGAVHVSTEYLKWPIETGSKEFDRLSSVFPEMLAAYRTLGAHRIGREYTLPSSVTFPKLASLKRSAESLGLRFGFAETELLHLNAFSACCNASDFVLRDAHFFDATILGLVKKQLNQKLLKFPSKIAQWLPEKSVFRHINSRSRPNDFEGTARERHVEFLRRKWNADPWRGGPASFLGITNTSTVDAVGNRVYACNLAVEPGATNSKYHNRSTSKRQLSDG